ncbi:MAG: hypothetical protein ACLPPF_24065 [Rhodomicrobium sp.]
MTDENGKIESHTQALLREICERLDRIEGTQAEDSQTLAEHTHTLAEHSVLLNALVKAVTAIDANQQKQTEILKELSELGCNHGARLNAIDGRPGLIEGRVGLAHV